MNNYIDIEVKDYTSRFIRKCMNAGISLYQIDYLEAEKLLVKINLKDYKKIKKLNYYSKIKIIRYEGTTGVKRHIKRHLQRYIIVLLCFVLMDVITSYIVRIDIIHENKKIRELVADELKLSGIEKFRLAQDFDELEVIKNKILEDNPTKLEWLSITRVGMTYVVRIEERILTDTSKEEGFAHLVSSKDALITKVISKKGTMLVRSGDYVKKGDILISGEIKLYEAVKGNTLATGEVYGNVWYQSTVSFPLVSEEKVYTEKKRFNMSINNKILFKNKYQLFEQKKVRKLRILGLNISLYTEVEYKVDKHKYTLKEAENLALGQVEGAMQKKLGAKGTVISKKVLQKEQNNSTISMSVFIITNELISERIFYTPGSEINDSEDSN